jgi:hypothetical protein
MSCIQAKEQASSTLASDVLTTPVRVRVRRRGAWQRAALRRHRAERAARDLRGFRDRLARGHVRGPGRVNTRDRARRARAVGGGPGHNERQARATGDRVFGDGDLIRAGSGTLLDGGPGDDLIVSRAAPPCARAPGATRYASGRSDLAVCASGSHDSPIYANRGDTVTPACRPHHSRVLDRLARPVAPQRPHRAQQPVSGDGSKRQPLHGHFRPRRACRRNRLARPRGCRRLVGCHLLSCRAGRQRTDAGTASGQAAPAVGSSPGRSPISRPWVGSSSGRDPVSRPWVGSSSGRDPVSRPWVGSSSGRDPVSRPWVGSSSGRDPVSRPWVGSSLFVKADSFRLSEPRFARRGIHLRFTTGEQPRQ